MVATAMRHSNDGERWDCAILSNYAKLFFLKIYRMKMIGLWFLYRDEREFLPLVNEVRRISATAAMEMKHADTLFFFFFFLLLRQRMRQVVGSLITTSRMEIKGLRDEVPLTDRSTTGIDHKDPSSLLRSMHAHR
ncbi:hypothetical protein MUK42_24801 [Musa troglodytarum]|uniref:Uncharacterized protein n=1 Tax=Musa troglodytarum TaxID=320322 RepID=A0A9E7IE69_9LILI|nr:hypothetical protein MUK42_24801 [Musa troglodytarum]